MNLGNRIAVISDVHGERQLLSDVLSRCHTRRVSSIVLLGDLFDRLDQAGACAQCLEGWQVAAVLGNHEREVLQGNGDRSAASNAMTRLLGSMTDRLEVDGALFIHDGYDWKVGGSYITFAGHTHYREARDDNGPLDLSLGRIKLRPDRRYLVNPGAVVDGQFAVWDRATAEIIFERV